MEDLVGFRFDPTEEEIIRLLETKRLDPGFSVHAITEANIYNFEPAELFGLSQIQSDEKWFFCLPDYIKAGSGRVHRTTKKGFWKATGKVRKINSKDGTIVIGSRRILVYGPVPKGTKPLWVMHQYSAQDNPLYKKDFVVCRIKRNRDKKRRNSTYVKGRQHKKLRTSTEVEHQQHQNPCISILNEGQVDQHLALDSHSNATGNIFPESHFSPSNYLVCDSRNHVAESTFLESQLPPNSSLISTFRNHVEENTSISESRNHVDECTSISESRNRVDECTSISESRSVEESTSSELQLLLQVLPVNYFISKSRNHVGENTSPELQSLTNDYLISESRNHSEENNSPEYEFSSLLPANGYLISEYGNPVEENTSSESLSSNCMIFESENHVKENAYPALQSVPQFPPSNYMSSESRNHVEEYTYQELQLHPQCLPTGNPVEENTSSELLPSNYMISESRNHVEGYTSQELLLHPQCLSNNNLISNARNHVEGNVSLEQLLSSSFKISNSRNQVIENSYPKSQLQSISNLISNSGNHIEENALPVYFDLPTISNALREGNELAEASFSTLQPPNNQEQGSSYSTFSISDCPLLDSDWEIAFMNPQNL